MFITRQLRCLLRNLLPRCAAYSSIIAPDFSNVKDIFNFFWTAFFGLRQYIL